MSLHISLIVPVYNRPGEVDELLDSLTQQTRKDFEVVIVEDGSKDKCDHIVERYKDELDIQYFYKDNTGPGESRNYGCEKASGNYCVFLDSDCIIPQQYIDVVYNELANNYVDAYGAPDTAHESFSRLQKAINYAMTSIVTTGGVRGKVNKLDNYQPRSFNMGLSSEVYKKVGGFRDIHPGEDPDLSYRIINAGFRIGFIKLAYVFHKRRIDLAKFVKQVYKFSVARTILMKWYPDKRKIVYSFPSLFFIGSVLLVLLSNFYSVFFIVPIAALTLFIFIESLIKTKSLLIALLSIIASFVQLYVYGYGFLKGIMKIFILQQPERKAFSNFFFNKNKQ